MIVSTLSYLACLKIMSRGGLRLCSVILAMACLALSHVALAQSGNATNQASKPTHESSLTAWAKTKGWIQSPHGGTGFADPAGNTDIFIVHDRGQWSKQAPYEDHTDWTTDHSTKKRENIVANGGFRAVRIHNTFKKDATKYIPGYEQEGWEYYCDAFKVLVRSRRDTLNNEPGEDPIGILEDYLAFARKFMHISPAPAPGTSHEIKITWGPQASANPAFPGQQIECIVAAQDSLGHQLKYKWTALGGTVGFNDPTLKKPTWTVQPNNTEDMVNWPIAVEVSCDHGASAKAHYIQKVWPTDNPQAAKSRDSFSASKVKGDVQVDRGEYGMKPIKEWDIIRVGDIIVTGANSHVKLISPVYQGALRIGPNSRVKIIEKSALSMSQRWQKFKKISALIIDNLNSGLKTMEGRPFFCLDEGTYYINNIPAYGFVANFLEYFVKPLPKQPIEEDAPAIKYSGLYIEDRGTIYSVTHSKSTGEKSVSVVEGEVIAVCDLQPETVWSVKAGEKN